MLYKALSFDKIFDKKGDMQLNKIWQDPTTLRVDTYKSGRFTFGLSVDIKALTPLLDRINDAQKRLNSIPTLPSVVDALREQVLASSVYSTNTIEGGEYSELETAQLLKQDPKTLQSLNEKRLLNLKLAWQWVKQTASTTKANAYGNAPISPALAVHIHRLVCQGLDETIAGQYRDNQQGQKTLVGNEHSGGTYRPPKCLDDISYLMHCLCEWANSDALMATNAVIRACLIHYYFELIHPFWDGNGRTGRLLEMLLLEQAGYYFSSSAIWRYYEQNITQYFALFNHCRKLVGKTLNPNQAFAQFVLDGLFVTINELHDQTNHLLKTLLLQSELIKARTNKQINDRQFNLMAYLTDAGVAVKQSELIALPAVKAIYQGKSDRTFYRDVKGLLDLGFLKDNGKLSLNN